MKRTIGLFILSMLILFTIVVSSPNKTYGIDPINRTELNEHDYDSFVWNETFSNDIVSYQTYKDNGYPVTTSSEYISFNSPTDLYNFSRDASYNYSTLNTQQLTNLMSNNYILGRDIDYSVMRSRRFVPIGYDFSYISDSSNHFLEFNGTFNGRGFEITNLYLSGYDSVIVEDNVNPEDLTDVVDIAISTYHAMFNHVGSAGQIRNLGLINPTIDMDVDTPDIRYFANLVGSNNGFVDSVYVIDNRTINTGGMRVEATPSSNETRQKSAAGLIHTNNNIFTNAYYAGRSVVNQSYNYALFVEPVIYYGNTNNSLVFDNELYQLDSNFISPLNSTPLTTIQLKQENASNGLSQNWYYYELDRYPALWGLSYDSIEKEYSINSALDMITFTKLLRLNTQNDNKSYRASTYVVNNDIDFNTIAKNTYVVPSVEFSGVFNGKNKQISNLTLSKGVNISDGYYIGLFSIVSGIVKNLKLYNYNILPVDYGNNYGQHFYIGSVAGILDGGLINNVYINGEINLGESKLGVFSVGGIVGQASGQIIRVRNESSINLGVHTFSNEILETKFNAGGIVGNTSSKKLVIYNALNLGDITGYKATNLNTSNNLATFNTGGVIGFVENINSINIIHNMGLMSNEGNITLKNITGSATVTNHLGGVIGYSTGTTYENNEFQGLWENKGSFNLQGVLNQTKAAGIVVTNHETLVRLVQLFNTSNFDINSNNLKVATLVYNMSTQPINIYQATSKGNYNYSVVNQDLSVAIYNENNPLMDLKYIEVENNIVINANNTTEVSYSGVTLSKNTNYESVIFDGNISVTDLGTTANAHLWVSGIAKELSVGKKMINSMSHGNLDIVANKSGNIYLGGMVNKNLAGNLNLQDASSRPKATLGIINSINQMNIESPIIPSGNGNATGGIRGTTNVYAGGVATMNSGSIQDVVNLGNIKIVNLDNYVASRVSLTGNESLAGMAESYKSAVLLGGISSIITNGRSRIYDTSNKGDIIGISRHLVRTGGVLGISLLVELNAGGINAAHYSTTTDINNEQYISNSILSNGINYGSVSAISEKIGEYSNNENIQSQAIYANVNNNETTPVNRGNPIAMNSTQATVERIGVYSSSGGVIGYGLSKMYRMINHGQVSATDAAGGIVGATFVYVAGTGTSDQITIVHINTAINYGSIKAIKNTMYNEVINNGGELALVPGIFYTNADNYIIPLKLNNNIDIKRHPQSKRGFGGIFGRIQRGGNQVMTSVGGSFDFIVNMDENIDLIGRLDQNYNFSWSGSAFKFYDAKYYSAKENDTTQAVFTGFEYENFPGTTITRAKQPTVERRYRYYSVSSWWGGRTNYRQMQYLVNVSDVNRTIYHQIGERSTLISPYEDDLEQFIWIDFGNPSSGSYPTGGYSSLDPLTLNATETIQIQSQYRLLKIKEVPYISEMDNVAGSQYVYDSNFEMRKDDTTLTNGESITSYIYYAERDLLADQFYNTRVNGMYVLSTTSGSNFGSVLPRNLDIQKFKTLNREIPTNSNYSNITNNNYFYPVESSLIAKYQGLYQTKLNEKSELLEVDQIFEIDDSSPSRINLKDPIIDYSNKTITFSFKEALVDIIPGQPNILDFDITSALLPSGALITNNTYSTWAQLQAAINANNYKPDLTFDMSTIVATQDIYELGKFISYSEAALDDELFFQTYFTEYTIYLDVDQTPVEKPSNHRINEDGSGWVAYNQNTQIINKLGVQFLDTASSSFVTPTYTMEEYITLYYRDFETAVEEIVDPQHYTITNTYVINNLFSFEITFKDELRPSELYSLGYKFYEADIEQRININYNKQTRNEIDNLIAITGTYYLQGEGIINGDIGFGDESILTFSNDLDFLVRNPIVGAANYLNNATYELKGVNLLEVSDFMDILDVNVIKTLSSTKLGYYIYELEFIIRNEANIYIQLEEKTLVPTYFKDGIRIPSGSTSITREAEQTVISIDYNFLNQVIGNLDVSDFILSMNDNNIIKSFSNGILRISFTEELLPGMYSINIDLLRQTELITNIATLNIEKLKGTDAYLKDIKFSDIPTETSYGEINGANYKGEIIPGYTTDIYFGGIDYGDASHLKNFRVDGEVSRIPLDEYLPLMVDYLPLGAKIQRVTGYDINGYPNAYTPYVDANTDIASTEYNELFGNFTIDPVTGLPAEESSETVISYRVTSEDETQGIIDQVYYHITITDMEFNVTMNFDYKFETTNGLIDLKDSILNDRLFKVHIANYDVADGTTIYEPGAILATRRDTVAEFLPFDRIIKRNTVINMFYVPNIEGLSYRLARNLSGFYQIKIDVPQGYDYDIYLGTQVTPQARLNPFSNYISEGNNEGYYYYINSSVKLRSRQFIVVIKAQTQEDGWGLTDSN